MIAGKLFRLKNVLLFPSFFSKAQLCLGVGYSNHTNIRNGS